MYKNHVLRNPRYRKDYIASLFLCHVAVSFPRILEEIKLSPRADCYSDFLLSSLYSLCQQISATSRYTLYYAYC